MHSFLDLLLFQIRYFNRNVERRENGLLGLAPPNDSPSKTTPRAVFEGESPGEPPFVLNQPALGRNLTYAPPLWTRSYSNPLDGTLETRKV